VFTHKPTGHQNYRGGLTSTGAFVCCFCTTLAYTTMLSLLTGN